jgi:putative colanic acid biosynthesis UDP-glucose lipid carrier transferase
MKRYEGSSPVYKQNFQGMVRPYENRFATLAKLADFAVIYCVFWGLCYILNEPWENHFGVASLAAVLFVFFGEIVTVYHTRRGGRLFEEISKIVTCWLVISSLLLFIGYALKLSQDFSRLLIMLWFAAVPLSLSLWRIILNMALRFVRSYGLNSRSYVIAGATASGARLASVVQESPWMGLQCKGVFDDRSPQSGRLEWKVEVAGRFADLLERARACEIDIVYITLPAKASDRINELLDSFADTTVSVFVVPDLTLVNIAQGRWLNLGLLPVISVFETPFYGLSGWFKRLEDIVLALMILLLVGLPMIVFAAIVRLSSPGPALFKQRRYGLDGREILVYKFRTMRVCEDGERIPQATRCDTRITRFGSFLRHTSLDELPQLFNVLRGDMSIVGPRPHAVVHNEIYRKLIKGYMLRHKVKPGITGWAQINGWRGETDTVFKMEQRVKFDIWYIYHWSLWLDLKIILLTLVKGFVGKNAY